MFYSDLRRIQRACQLANAPSRRFKVGVNTRFFRGPTETGLGASAYLGAARPEAYGATPSNQIASWQPELDPRLSFLALRPVWLGCRTESFPCTDWRYMGGLHEIAISLSNDRWNGWYRGNRNSCSGQSLSLYIYYEMKGFDQRSRPFSCREQLATRWLLGVSLRQARGN